MTLILARAGFMCADRRITDSEGGTGSMVKIAKNARLIAAAAGNAASSLAVKRAVRKGAQCVEDLIEHVDKDSYALVLTPEGRLWRIESEVVWPCEAGRTHAIGSGADRALGYLDGIGGDVTPSLVRKVQRYVSTKRSDCGGGCDVRAFLA